MCVRVGGGGCSGARRTNAADPPTAGVFRTPLIAFVTLDCAASRSRHPLPAVPCYVPCVA